LPLVYDELRKLAAQKLAKEKPGQTLDPGSPHRPGQVAPETDRAVRRAGDEDFAIGAEADAADTADSMLLLSNGV
jgi:hypothetical protein